MTRSVLIGYFRVSAATLAAVVATVICIVQRHVHIVFSNPSTYSSLFSHRCGALMVDCIGWAVFEWMRQWFAPPAFAQRAFEEGVPDNGHCSCVEG